MKIPLEQAVGGLVSFLSGEASKISSMGDKFLMYGALGAIKANPSRVLAKYIETMEMLGIVSEGMVDVDAVKSALDSAFDAVPNFHAIGFTFTRDDVPALVRNMGV